MQDMTDNLNKLVGTSVTAQLNTPYICITGTLKKDKFGGEYQVFSKDSSGVFCFRPEWVDRIIKDQIYVELKNVRKQK